MRTKKLLMILVLGLMAVSPMLLEAQSHGAVLVLLIEPGSRPGGMGGAFVAQADDNFTAYWNPGALAFQRSTKIGVMHTNWLGDVNGIDDLYLEHAAWSSYLEGVGTLGADIHFMTYGDQQRTDEAGVDQGTFSSWEIFPSITYSDLITENIGVGVTFKFIYSHLSDEGTGQTEQDASGIGMSWAFDFGTKIKDLGIENLDFGLNIMNVGPKITYINESQADPLPLNWKMGFAYKAYQDEFNRLIVTADMNKELANDDGVGGIVSGWTDDKDHEIEQTIFNVGSEYTYWDMFSIRGGYYYDKGGEVIGFSFGAGLSYTYETDTLLRIDFAMTPAGELTDYNKTFTFGVDFF